MDSDQALRSSRRRSSASRNALLTSPPGLCPLLRPEKFPRRKPWISILSSLAWVRVGNAVSPINRTTQHAGRTRLCAHHPTPESFLRKLLSVSFGDGGNPLPSGEVCLARCERCEHQPYFASPAGRGRRVAAGGGEGGG